MHYLCKDIQMNKTLAIKKISAIVIKMKSDRDKSGVQYLSRDILLINTIKQMASEFNLPIPKYCEVYDELVIELSRTVLNDFISKKNNTIKKNMIVIFTMHYLSILLNH